MCRLALYWWQNLSLVDITEGKKYKWNSTEDLYILEIRYTFLNVYKSDKDNIEKIKCLHKKTLKTAKNLIKSYFVAFFITCSYGGGDRGVTAGFCWSYPWWFGFVCWMTGILLWLAFGWWSVGTLFWSYPAWFGLVATTTLPANHEIR